MIGLAILVAATFQASAPDFTTHRDGRDIFPPAFHGTWAPSPAECGGGNWVRFDAATFRAPDNLGTLIRHVEVRRHPPSGQHAVTLVAQVEFNSEDQVSRGEVRISRAGPYLYMSNPEMVSDREHWRMRNVRCPD